MKRTIAALTCATALATSLTACGGEAKSSLPLYTPAASPSSTATSTPTSTPTTPPTTAGPVALAAHTTYTYGGLKVIVNLPAEIPSASRPTLQLFTKFLQAISRTIAENALDPSVSDIASAEMVKYVRSFTDDASVRAIGDMSYTVNEVQSGTSGVAVITGCADQSKLVQVRKDGSHFVGSGVKKYPTMRMTADINPGEQGAKVTGFKISTGSC